MLRKKMVSLLLAFIMILATSVDVLACVTTPAPPTITTPAKVSVNKTAKWVDDEYAMVTLDVNGQPNLSGADYIVVLDKSKSMNDYNRFAIAKEASNKLVDQIMAPIEYVDENGVTKTVASNNRVSFMSFSSCSYKLDCGKFYTASTANANYIKNHINGLKTLTCASNYSTAICNINTTISCRPSSEKSRPVYVSFISSGETKLYACFDSYLNTMKSLTAGVNTAGLTVTNTVGRSLLQQMAKAPGTYREVTTDTNVLVDGYKSLGGYALRAALVTDLMGDRFTLVPNSTQYPWTVTDNGVKVNAPRITTNSTSGNDALQWIIGDFNGNAKFTYYIKIKENTPVGKIYDTNLWAQLSYCNSVGNGTSVYFPVPTLAYPGHSIRKVYYMTNAAGNPISANGTVIANTLDSILNNGVILKDEYVKENGKRLLQLNKAYSETVGDFTKDNIDYKNNSLRTVSGTGTYTTIGGNQWTLTLKTEQDFYTVLAGYIPKLVYTVSHQYGDAQPQVTTKSADYGQSILESPINKIEYTFDSVKITAVDGNGTPIAHNLVINANNQVVGTMPNGNVTIEYKYKPLGDILYMVRYYKDSAAGTPFKTVVDFGTYQDVIPVDIEGNVPDGYYPTATVTGPTNIGITGNIVNVVYNSPIPKYKYGIEYRTQDGTVLGRVPYEAVYEGTEITLTQEQLNAFWPGIEYEDGVLMNPPAIIVSNNQILRVVYKQKTQQKITIKHYGQVTSGSSEYTLLDTTYEYAYSGEELRCEDYETYLGGNYMLDTDSSPEVYIVKNGNNEFSLKYTRLDLRKADSSDTVTAADNSKTAANIETIEEIEEIEAIEAIEEIEALLD